MGHCLLSTVEVVWSLFRGLETTFLSDGSVAKDPTWELSSLDGNIKDFYLWWFKSDCWLGKPETCFRGSFTLANWMEGTRSLILSFNRLSVSHINCQKMVVASSWVWSDTLFLRMTCFRDRGLSECVAFHQISASVFVLIMYAVLCFIWFCTCFSWPWCYPGIVHREGSL